MKQCRFQRIIGRLIVLAVVGIASCSATTSLGTADAAGSATRLLGAGSTFDAPFFTRAFAEYSRLDGVDISYRAVGSGAGVEQFSAGAVDFGASDVPMNEYQLGETVLERGAVVQIPVALGGVAIIYNLPGFTQTLRLDGAVLAQIFLGGITRWDDPALRALNPGAALPDAKITPVHRADGSGTTYITTDYFQSVSTDWYTRLGKGVRVAWPTGIAGVGSPGLLHAVESHPDSIGYVEMSYALADRVPMAAIRNGTGAFVLPSQESVSAAADQYSTIDWQHFSIVNAPGTASYPIAGYSWALLRQHPKSNAAALVQLFKWLTTDGQQYAAELQYVALPAQARQLAAQELGTVS